METRLDSQTMMEVTARLGGMSNPFTGLGTSSDRSTASQIAKGYTLTRYEINALYEDDTLIQKAVNLVVQESYRNWVDFNFSDDTKLKSADFLQYMWQMKFGKGQIAAREAFRDASILARKDGDAFILVGVADNAEIFEPVGDRVETIAWLKVMSRYDLLPEPLWEAMQSEYSDSYMPQDPQRPEFYRVAYNNQRIHHSRVLRFSGSRILDGRDLARNRYFHHSVIQAMYKAYARWEEGVGYGAAILGDIETYTLGYKGLGELLKRDRQNNNTDGQDAILQRGMSLSMGRSALKTMLYDLDNELPGSVARGYAGADGIMDRLERIWAASTNTPRWKLFEESGGAGLASSVGSAQILRFAWADIASSWAFENWKEPIDQLAQMIFLAKDGPTRGKIPEEWNEGSAKFPNTIALSLSEQMELEKLAAERSQILVTAGAIGPEEVRRGYEGETFSVRLPLLPEVGEHMAKTKEMATAQQELGLKAQEKDLAAPAPKPKQDSIDLPPEVMLNARNALDYLRSHPEERVDGAVVELAEAIASGLVSAEQMGRWSGLLKGE